MERLELKTIYERESNSHISCSSSTKCKNKWAVTIFGERLSSRSVIAKV